MDKNVCYSFFVGYVPDEETQLLAELAKFHMRDKKQSKRQHVHQMYFSAISYIYQFEIKYFC